MRVSRPNASGSCWTRGYHDSVMKIGVLALQGDVAGKILDALNRPQPYREIVEEVRRHLATHHSYRHRLQELMAALTAPVPTRSLPCSSASSPLRGGG